MTSSDSLRLIYPNPDNGSTLNISFVNPLQYNANVVILNMSGTFILGAELLAGIDTYQLNVSRLTNGFYYIKIFDNYGLNVIKQFIIQR